MKIKIKKRNTLQWATIFVIGTLMVVRIPMLMYIIQAVFLLFAIPKAVHSKISKCQIEYLYCNLAFILVSALSLIWSSNTSYSISSVVSILQVFLISFLIFITCNKKNDYYDIIDKFSIISWIFMAYIIFSTSKEEWKTIFAYNTNLSSSAGRLGPSVGMHTNMCGAVLSILIMFSFYEYLSKKNKVSLIQTILLLVFLTLTKSRMSILVVVLGMSLYYTIYKELSGKQAIKIIGVLIVLIILLVLSMSNQFLYNLYGNRIESMFNFFSKTANTDASVTGRLALQQRAIEVFLNHPILGVGIGNFSSYSNNLGGVSGFYAHNNFLELLADVGIVGTVMYYTPYVIALVKTRTVAKRCESKAAMFFNFLFVLIVVRLLSDISQVSYLFDSSQLVLVLVFVALRIEYEHPEMETSGIKSNV